MFMLASALLMAAPAPAMAQNFFEALFGGFQPQASAYAPPPREQRLWRYENGEAVARAPGPRSLEEAYGKPEKVPPPLVGPGPLGPFLNDPTLRFGDVVVTTQGLMVYRGGGGSRHSPRDFVSLSKAGSKTAQLAAIERANRRGQSPLVVADNEPAPKPAAAAAAPAPAPKPPAQTASRRNR
jgi:hypothetical protein